MTTATQTRSPQQILKELRELTAEVGPRNYQRIALAAELLADRDWVLAEHGGNQFAACHVLEDEFFHDLCSSLGLFGLLNIYRRYPKEVDWKRVGYHLGKLHDSLKTHEKRPAVRRATIAELDQREAKIEELRAELKHKNNLHKAAADNEARLAKQVAAQELEIARLKGRVGELERILEVLHPGSTK